MSNKKTINLKGIYIRKLVQTLELKLKVSMRIKTYLKYQLPKTLIDYYSENSPYSFNMNPRKRILIGFEECK